MTAQGVCQHCKNTGCMACAYCDRKPIRTEENTGRDICAALTMCLGVLEEPGIMDVDEWKAWQKQAIIAARAALAKAGKS